jgi:ubiquinone/menaquinone biosynthesis C-methylase UbiE
MTLPFGQTSFPEVYESEIVGPLFRPFAELLLVDAAPTPGEHVLDIACGTGIVARLAKSRVGATGNVVGIDLNPAMLTVARRVAPDIDWRAGDAGALPLHDGESFDLVLCQQGLQFFPDKPAAARQMRRALAPGGRLAVSTWRSDEELLVLRELRRIAERHVGPIVDRRHGFGDSHGLSELFRDAGFSDVETKTASRTVRFADGSVYARLNASALVGMSAMKDAGEEERGRIVAAIARDSDGVVQAHTDGTGFAFELVTNVATARG